MPGGGSKPGERRGGRQKGTPNKLPKGERALVKLDAAEAEVRALKAEGLPLETLGKDRLAELDAWAHAMALQFAPKKDEKTGRLPSCSRTTSPLPCGCEPSAHKQARSAPRAKQPLGRPAPARPAHTRPPAAGIRQNRGLGGKSRSKVAKSSEVLRAFH